MTSFGIRDIAELRIGNVKQLRQLCAVGCRLIEQQQKFRVGEHQTRRFGFQTFFYVLACRCQRSTVFAESFPCAVKDFAGVFVFEIQVG